MTRSGKDKARIIVYLLMICAVLIGFVGLTAHTAKLQYDINRLNRNIRETASVVKSLEVKIKTTSNITNIEERAMQLGFVYPNFDHVKYLTADDEPMHDFALALMETAYR